MRGERSGTKPITESTGNYSDSERSTSTLGRKCWFLGTLMQFLVEGYIVFLEPGTGADQWEMFYPIAARMRTISGKSNHS